jgi:hypothetical protein
MPTLATPTKGSFNKPIHFWDRQLHCSLIYQANSFVDEERESEPQASSINGDSVSPLFLNQIINHSFCLSILITSSQTNI